MGLRQLLAAGGPLKIIKGAFYFIFQAYFVLKILNVCPDFLSCSKTV